MAKNKYVDIKIEDGDDAVEISVAFRNESDGFSWKDATPAQKTGVVLSEFAEAQIPIRAKRDLAKALNSNDLRSAVIILFLLGASREVDPSGLSMAMLEASFNSGDSIDIDAILKGEPDDTAN